MALKIKIITFVAAFIFVIARILIGRADYNGNIYIRSPRNYFLDIQLGYEKAKGHFSRKKKGDVYGKAK